MNSPYCSKRTKSVLMIAPAALISASLLATAPAIAQQPAEITVVTPHIERMEVGRAYSGVPIERVSLASRVGYGDLDLATPSGAATLRSRIADTAKRACSQLDTLFPDSLYPPEPANQDCVKAAIDDAMTQTRVAGIATAGLTAAPVHGDRAPSLAALGAPTY